MRSAAPRASLAALALLGALAGCATPQYQTSVRLIPPAGAAGRACVQACDAGKASCQTDCQTRYQACSKAIEPRVEAAYAEALKKYELDLKRYATALQQYELQLRFEWMNSYPFHSPYWWDPWPGPYFPPPYPAPTMPTREGVRAQLEKSSCRADCGCLPNYDSCFVGCGGQRISETRCIKNCPPAK